MANKTKRQSADALPGGKADDVAAGELDSRKEKQGTKHELEHTKNRTLAAEIARDHLVEDINYYDKLEELESKDVKKGGAETPEARRARNAKPHNRAARRNYNKSEKGRAAVERAKTTYETKYPDRHKARQKIKHLSADGHKCARCGAPAKHKHHLSYKSAKDFVWLCHAHHVKAHHPRSNMSKATYTIPLAKARTPAADAGYRLLKSLRSDDWWCAFHGTDMYAKALDLRDTQVEERMSLMKHLRRAGSALTEQRRQASQQSLDAAHNDAREMLLVQLLKSQAKQLKKSMTLPEAGYAVTMDVNDDFGDKLRYWDQIKLHVSLPQAILSFASADDLGAWATLDLGPKLRLHLMEMLQEAQVDLASMGAADRSVDVKKSELYARIRAQNVTDLCKSLVSIEHGEGVGAGGDALGVDRKLGSGVSVPAAGSSPKSGMPAAENAPQEIWSDDDRAPEQQMSDGQSSMERAAGKQGGSPDLAQTANEIKKSAFAVGGWLVNTSLDSYIAKALDERGCIAVEPTIGVPNSPLLEAHSCINDLCKGMVPAILTNCPSCGGDQRQQYLVKGASTMVMDSQVAASLRPQRNQMLSLPAGVDVE